MKTKVKILKVILFMVLILGVCFVHASFNVSDNNPFIENESESETLTLEPETYFIVAETQPMETQIEDQETETRVLETSTQAFPQETFEINTTTEEDIGTKVADIECETEPIIEVATDELRYMAAIIYAEAGDQGYAGQCAVGIVVMNRIRNNEFPDNLYDVIYQRGQFTPTVNGSFDKALYLYDIGELPDSCINAAIYALEGNIYVEHNGEIIDMSTYHFFMMSMRNYRLNIQDHYFK